MAWKLSHGDYVPDGAGGLTALKGGEEMLARVEQFLEEMAATN